MFFGAAAGPRAAIRMRVVLLHFSQLIFSSGERLFGVVSDVTSLVLSQRLLLGREPDAGLAGLWLARLQLERLG